MWWDKETIKSSTTTCAIGLMDQTIAGSPLCFFGGKTSSSSSLQLKFGFPKDCGFDDEFLPFGFPLAGTEAPFLFFAGSPVVAFVWFCGKTSGRGWNLHIIGKLRNIARCNMNMSWLLLVNATNSYRSEKSTEIQTLCKVMISPNENWDIFTLLHCKLSEYLLIWFLLSFLFSISMT